MRVLHVDSARGWRGGQNQVLLTARGMQARGHEVLLACQAGGVLESRARSEGLAVAPVSFRGDLSPAAVWSVRRAWSAFRPEVVQLHDPHALSAGILAAFLRRRGRGPAPVLVATRRVDFPLRGALSQMKYRSCARVIAVSRAIARVLETGGLDPARVRVVYEGVPDRQPGAGAPEALRALGIPPGHPVVGNVAALTDHKDHHTLLEAAARVIAGAPEVFFVIVGDGELRQGLEARAKALGLGTRCVFAGFRPDLDVLIPSFTLFCLSSWMEGLGTSVLDAMAFGRAVVATAAGGIPEAVEDGVTGRIVPVRDPAALAAALLDLLSDHVLREQMGRVARRRFEERFTAERMVEETLAVYRDALEPRRGPGGPLPVKPAPGRSPPRQGSTWAILNPRAGVAARRARKAIEEHRDRWGDLEVRTTESAGHARVLAQEAVEAGATTVLAVGGDGTVNEVAWGLLGTTVTLGLVPVGSGNGLARTLGIPLRPDRALASLEAAVVRGMDVGLVNGRPFLNVAGAGFDAEVGAAFHRNGARGGRRGVLTYVRLGFSKLTYQAEDWVLSTGEEGFEGRALIVAFVNGRQYGGGAIIAPRARLDDGLLDIVVIEDAPRAEIVWNAPRVFLGSIEGFRRYRHRTASSAVLTSKTGAFEHHRDGEPEPSSERLEVAVRPRALRVLVPRGVAEDPTGPFGD